MIDNQTSQTGNIARVAVKAPPFWRANPEIWFRQMDSQFQLAGINVEITKFHHIVSALQPEELAVVGDILLNPSTENPYAPSGTVFAPNTPIPKNSV